MSEHDEEFHNPRYVVGGDEATVANRQVAVDPTVAQPVAPAAMAQPVVAAPVVQPVANPVVEAPEVRRVATTSRRRYAPDSVVVGIVGLVMLTFGLIVLARAGLDGPMDQPVVEVLGFTHTATLGFIEAGLGLCLLICAVTTSRSGAVFFGLVLGVAGVVGAVQTSSFERRLALQSSFAWIAVGAAAVVVLASLLLPRGAVESSRVETV